MFHLIIATVDSILFDGDVYAATCPGSGGELTVLARHMPLITTLEEGGVRVLETKDSKPRTFAVTRGLLEVANNRATILI